MPANEKGPKTIRVLVADDNNEMRNTIVRLLKDEYEVVGAVGDGRALIDAAMDFNPDIGIIDISMPVMTGIQAVNHLRSCGSTMKAIFLTVNEDADFVHAAFDAGGMGYVIKRQMTADLRVALTAALADEKFVSPGCGLPMF
jgi:DNA-binding NarL/FixJ family response regulator